MKVGPYKVSLAAARSSSQAERARPPAGGRGEEMQGGIMAKSSVKISLGKPLEELMDSDIMELSREDCRQYLQERGNDAVLFCVMVFLSLETQIDGSLW
jgi:hypothetical protein